LKGMGKLFALILLVIIIGGAAGAYFLMKGGLGGGAAPSPGAGPGITSSPTPSPSPTPTPTEAPQTEKEIKCCELLKMERMASSGLRTEYEVTIKRFFENGSTDTIVVGYTYWAEDLGDRYALTVEMNPITGLSLAKATFVGYYTKDNLDFIEAYVQIDMPQGPPYKQNVSFEQFPSLCARETSEYVETIDRGQETIIVPAGTFKCNVYDLVASDLPEPARYWFSAEEGPLNGYVIKGFYRDSETEILIQLVSWSLP